MPPPLPAIVLRFSKNSQKKRGNLFRLPLGNATLSGCVGGDLLANLNHGLLCGSGRRSLRLAGLVAVSNEPVRTGTFLDFLFLVNFLGGSFFGDFFFRD